MEGRQEAGGRSRRQFQTEQDVRRKLVVRPLVACSNKEGGARAVHLNQLRFPAAAAAATPPPTKDGYYPSRSLAARASASSLSPSRLFSMSLSAAAANSANVGGAYVYLLVLKKLKGKDHQ